MEPTTQEDLYIFLYISIKIAFNDKQVYLPNKVGNVYLINKRWKPAAPALITDYKR